eukprot:TRINITY_DN4467_c0_g1_i2.p1 TRINITY_DN4467_c0_g1~~TRINITY_DN4467_c0_g1_i2.p1  ORF type:complete len:393 (-),score=101.86 TRINITY_DN4467_c0_g1_i2:149-1258(-)
MPVKERSRAPSAPPPFGMKEIKQAIPPHCFVHSNLKSFSYLAIDLAVCAALYYVAITFIPLLPSLLQVIAWPAWAIVQGNHLTALWVIAHECGHYAFSDSKLICDIVGFPLHTFLLVPYHSWRISHREHHHFTCDMERDEVFIPAKEEDGVHGPHNGEAHPLRVLIESLLLFGIGWQMYLTTHVTGRKYPRHTDHFSPSSPIFEPSEYTDVLISTLGIIAWLAVLSYVAFFVTGPMWVFKLFVMPYMVTNFWLLLYTKLHHTDVELPHFSGKDWTWVRGAISTIDRDYGFFNLVHHHIGDTHVAHHLFSRMPFYHAQEATEALKPVLGKYYRKSDAPISQALWSCMNDCRYVVPEKPGEKDNIWWFQRN